MAMDYMWTVLSSVSIAVLLSLGMNVAVGYAGLMWLTLPAMMGFGAYAYAIATVDYGWPVLAAFALAGLVPAGASVTAGRIFSRLDHHSLILAAFALQIVLLKLLERTTSLTGGTNGFVGIPRPEVMTNAQDVAIALALVAVAATVVVLVLLRSMFGLSLRALRESPRSVAASGRSVAVLYGQALGVAGGLAGLAGALYAVQVQFIIPTDFGMALAITVLVGVIVGGVGNVAGAIVGAVFLSLVPVMLDEFSFLAPDTSSSMDLVIIGLVLIVAVKFRPSGLLPERPLASAESAAAGNQARADSVVSDGRDAIVIDDLTVRFGGITAVDHVSMRVRQGQVTALVGPNGAGKSTLLAAVTGLAPLRSGQVVVDGRPATAAPAHVVARLGVARTFQDLEVNARLTCLENVMLGLAPERGDHPFLVLVRPFAARRRWSNQIAAACQELSHVGLRQLADTVAGEIAYGEQKLLALARLGSSRAPILMLDEPGSGLTPDVAESVAAALKRLAGQGRTVVLVDHNMDLVRSCAEELVVLHQGRVLMVGEPDQVLADRQVMGAYLRSENAPAPAKTDQGVAGC